MIFHILAYFTLKSHTNMQTLSVKLKNVMLTKNEESKITATSLSIFLYQRYIFEQFIIIRLPSSSIK